MEVKECECCLSKIPKRALKCKYCLEWQEDNKININTSLEIKQLQVTKELIKIPFQSTLINKLPFHYFINTIIVGILLFTIIQLTWYKLDEDEIYLFSFLAFAIQFIIAWSCLIWISKVINKNYNYFIKVSSLTKEKAVAKFYEFNKIMFNTKKAIVTGVVIGLIAAVGDLIVGAPFKTLEAKFLFAGFEFIYMFFAGAAMYSIFYFAIFLNELTTSPKREIMSLSQKQSIHKIGSIHLKTSVLAVIPFFLGVIAKLIGNWSWDLPIVLWYVSFAIAILFYIYLPIINIHNYMTFDLENQKSKVQRKIRNKLGDIDKDPSSSNFSKLNELRVLESSISNQNTWPFDTKGLTAVLGTVILPIIIMIIDKLLML